MQRLHSVKISNIQVRESLIFIKEDRNLNSVSKDIQQSSHFISIVIYMNVQEIFVKKMI